MSSQPNTILTKQEKLWLLERRVSRLSDHKEVQIYPMGAERYLSSVLLREKKYRYDIAAHVKDKSVLVIPGFGNTCFLLAQAGAKSVTVCDKDPVTIAWMKAFKKYYHFREQAKSGEAYPSIGELLTALTAWYPPLLVLPKGHFKNKICWALNPQLLRRTYIFYMLSLVKKALTDKVKASFELAHDIRFYAGELHSLEAEKNINTFDTAYVPYLLGVRNGIESVEEIEGFMEQLLKLVPKGRVFVNPSRATKEFQLVGKRYFVTTGYPTVQSIPALQAYFVAEDKYWFRTQGLAVFSKQKLLG